MIPIRLLALVLALALAACGFRPRGEVQLPPGLQTVRIEIADDFSPLARDLGAALERAGATLASTDAAGAGVIRIPVNTLRVEPLTVSKAARVNEYLIAYRVELEVIDGAGATLLPRTPIELSRDYSYDETQALGAAAEQDLIRRELEREMVQQVLRRIATLGAR